MGRVNSATADIRNAVSASANTLVVTAVAANIVSVAITTATTGITSVISGSGGLVQAIQGTVAHQVPEADLSLLFLMLNYLQFVASGSHMTLPGAPDFYYEFTDALGWVNFQFSSSDGISNVSLSSGDASNFTVADGDIISGVLAYAERVHIKPEQLFTKTAIAFVSVVGVVAAIVASLYTLLRCLARERLEMVVEKLNDLPRAKLLVRLLIQSCLSICLLSEYALSMTSAFQMRYNQQNAGNSDSALAFATVALIVICCGLIVLGIAKLWNKTEEELAHPDFKFAWGAYYKYYRFEYRYFFVAKMGAEILSGVIIGLVSHVPTQLTLLMSVQLAMFMFTMECAPFSIDFQSNCTACAFLMKILTYALMSSFVTKSSSESELRHLVGSLVVLLQVLLLILFNSRQLHILYKQIKFMWQLRQQRKGEKRVLESGKDDSTRESSITALTSRFDTTPGNFARMDSKREVIASTPPHSAHPAA